MTLSVQKKIYLTDLEQNLTFTGFFKSYEEVNDNIIATMHDIEVYEYASSIPLFNLKEITFKKDKRKIYIESSARYLNN